MAFRDWLEKYRESQGSNNNTSKQSPAATTPSSSESETTTSGTTGGGDFREALRKYREQQSYTSIEGWANSSISLINDVRDKSGNWYDEEEYKSRYDSFTKLLSQADSWRKQYSGNPDAISYIDSVVDALAEAQSFSFNNRRYYSQWETAEDFGKYQQEQKDYEAKKTFDLDAGQKEIEDLEKLLDEYRALSRTMIDDRMQARLDNIRSQYGEEKDIKNLISQKKQYLNQAKHIQEGFTLAGVAENSDFEAYKGYTSTKDEGTLSRLTSQFGMGYKDLTYEYINGEQNGMRDEIIGKAVAYDYDTENYFVYDHMTDDQIAIYNYHYAKEGKEAADNYLDSIRETLNYQAATERYQKMEGNTALELLFAVEAGRDQFQSGIKNVFNTEDDYIAKTAYQMASGMVREDLADNGPKLPDWLGGASVGQMAYDTLNTSANMAPSILTSMAVGIINPMAGQVVGSTLMGMSAAGNAYQEALNQGYDKGQARAYSTLVGASEMVMEKVLGGISAVGGNALGKYLTKNLSNADTAFKMIAKRLGGSVLSEFSEEYLQEVLTPVFMNMTLGTDEEVKLFSPEALYSGILGALTAGVMEGPSTISTEVGTYQTGKQLQKADISAMRLAEIGSTFSADTVAYQLAGKVNESTGAYTMGRLFNEIGATMTEQNVSDITEALVKENMPREVARQNAEVMAQVVEGAQLSDTAIQVIEANEALSKAVRTTIIDQNSTWFQRTKGYNEALMALAQEQTAPKASRTEQSAPGQENAPAPDNVDAQNKVSPEAVSEVDTAPAKVKSISTIKDGQVTIKLEDGSEVNVKEADLDPEEGVFIETISQIDGISVNDANYILSTLKAAPGVNPQLSAIGAKEVYKYGYYGISEDHIAKHGVFSSALTETQRKSIYQTGRNARSSTVQQKTQQITQLTAEKSTGKSTGKVHFEGDRTRLTERQSASLSAMERIADALGVQIHVFESRVNERGKRIGANGWYDPKDSSIHIDLHAGANGEGTMLFTLAHELTHHIRKWSPAKFKILADFLMEEYGKKGVNVDGLVREQMNKAERNGRTISYDTAYEEVVADSMETMLADGNVMEKLEKLKAKDKSLWQKIKDFVAELAVKIRSVYEKMAPDSVEGRYVAEMVDSIEKLQELFTEALVDASTNYQSSLTPGEEGTIVNQNGDPVAHATADGTIQLSMRTYDEEGRKAFRDYLEKCVKSKKLTKAEMQDMLDGIEEIYGICKDFKDKYAPFSSWSDAAVVRDTHGKPVFSVVTPNGDYKMNLDFSLVCKKRRTLDAVFNEMTRRGIIDDFELGQKSVVKINEIIRKYGLETACALCFVDAKRFRQAAMADTFTSLYNELVESLVPEDQKGSIDHFNFSGYATIKKVEGGIDTWDNSKLDFSHINHVLKTYGDGTVEYKAAKYIKSNPEGRKLLLRGDFMSSKGFDAVKTQNPDVLKLYNSKKGTGGPKAAFGDVQYMNEVIQKARWWTPKKAYEVGGVRIQSFSDYVPRMVFDYVQMIYDLAATKLPAHAYTKEALFVKQFGLTGVKINMSLIPAIAEGGIAPGLDADGNYVWAGESFDFETAKEIQNAEGYTENCGTICVGVSYQHIVKLLGDPDIRMVIPYHKSGLNPIVAHMNKIAEFTDYTTLLTNPGGCQNTMDKNGSKVEKDFNFNEVLRKTGDPRATVRQYLDWCAKNEYKPRFAEFAWHENYYKLIEDFTLYDKDGKYVPQREVRAVFPKDTDAFGSMKALIKEGLEEDAIVEGKRDKRLASIVDEIQKTIPKTEAEIAEEQVAQADRDLEAIKRSDRPYSYESFISKPDMVVTTVGGNVPKNRADVVALAKENAAKVGKVDPKTGSVSVHVKDIDRDVGIGRDGLKHSIDRRMDVNAPVLLKAGEIISNSIRINELTPKKDRIDESYVLIGAARNADNELYIVRSVVNRFSHNLVSMDVLYAINAKKESAALLPLSTGKPALGTDSTISIAELLDYVNKYFPDILPEEVLKHYGHDSRPDGELGEAALYSDRDNAPTFYSQMAKVVDGVKQNKLGAASVVSMLRGKGVKAEEIKWSGIEEWLAGKKSVTKEELQEFIAGSMLQIEDDVLTNEEMPWSQEHLEQIAKYEAERDTIAENLKSEWKRIVGTDIPITYFGAGLESAVVNNLMEANATKKGNTEAGYKYKAKRAALQRVIEDGDHYFGFDNARQAFREALRNPNDFMKSYEMTSFEKGVFRDFIKAKEEYSKVEGISMEDQKALKAIAESADRFNRRIGKVKSEHYEEAAKHTTKYGSYTIRGGSNYRELLFRMPGATYSNTAMDIHWDRSGVLAHARIQDFNTFIGKMLFIEEIQSDWHNEGHKSGYNPFPEKEATVENTSIKLIDGRYYLCYRGKPLDKSMSAAFVDNRGYDMGRIHRSLVNGFNRDLPYDARVPDAPFRDNYHEYVLKRLLRMAAEQDYDSIGWTTADIQSKRWSGEYAEGYRIEYDQDIPKFLNKYGKKWGTKVGKTVLDNGTEVWSMAITDEMKDSVLTEGQPLYSDRDESVSNRSLLANAFEGVAQTDMEKQKIQEYKGKISLIESEERKLQELNEKIKDLSFKKGPKDTKAIRDLQFEAQQAANRISTYDKQLLRLEASKPLQDVLNREKKAAYKRAEQKGKEAMAAYRERATKTQRELMDKWQESRKKGIESREKTAVRHKIQNVVKELNDLLLNQSKKRHVPDNLKKAVADALALVNMDTVGAEERAAKYANLIARETDPDKIDAYTATMENLLRQGEKMGQRLKELRDAYEEIQESDDPDIANAYDPVIAGCLKELSGSIGNTSLRNMTIEQLNDVYDMYRMVLTRVRDANKTLLDNIKENIGSLASRVIGEVRMTGGEKKYRAAILDPVRKFMWNNLKPVYAMEHIGSSTLTKVFNNVRAGEDTWAKDVVEAREYYLDKSKKYGYDKWDFNKKHRFQSASELDFELTLEQMLSLYAYSKREQAGDHLKLGGFVFDSNIETYKEKGGKLKYKVNTADAHQITPEILAEITGKLTKEQKGFVDEMQEYLSTVMGAKGNEVTMKMYGVKLFKEKFYFPLKSAKQFMFEQNEVSGEVKIKNSGFTNKVVAKANNPVILSNFMEVWSGHVNDMSMYHAFVLPLEDFNRVFNYNSPKRENQPSVSVKGTIQNAYSPAAVNYVKGLITDLNGGARGDSTTGIINKLMGLFKKGSVFASLSVVVQQPSAIARAAALVDTKYFIGSKVDSKRHKALWEEVKKYAPVAIIKEMGYFDTNMGKSTQDYILGKEYSGFTEKMKALVTDSGYRDEVLSKAPALADEIAWCSIWDAVKRETKAKYPGLDIKGEPFLMLAGSRFTEVITKTQVYDSVLARSANMRSKDTGMKMATAFMAEPTTNINMITDALLQGKRGNRKYTRNAIGAVIASQIFNSILVSFVYAGRDDDEDQTYWEKYAESLSGKVLDSLNPMTYIPFIKDIVSITQGYDVERSDMAIISDLWKAWENLSKSNVSIYRKVEGFAGSIAQIFGLPLKNIMRDVRGIWQTYESFLSGQQTTKAGIGYAVKSALPEWLGGGDTSNQNQLYDAYLSGDATQIARVESRYKDQSAINSAIRKALRENDPRIRAAAEARAKGNLSEYTRLAKEIISEGHFSQDNVVAAINAEINAMSKDETTSTSAPKASGLYSADDFATAIASGDAAMANAVKADIIRTAQQNGKTAEEAEKSFASSAKSALKEMYLEGEISEQQVISGLISYCGAEEQEAMADVRYWEFKRDYPDVYADDSWFDAYYEDVADSGMDIGLYMEYRNAVKDITGDGKKERRMAYIHSLPITSEQKDALYFAEGWAASRLGEAPWH